MTSERPKAVGGTILSGIPSIEEHGNEPMTSEQADQLRALCEQHDKTFDSTLSRDAAARRIAEMKGDSGIVPPQS